MKDINILVFGDEIVDYKYILSHILEHDYSDNYYNVLNFEMWGDTTLDVKNRFDDECKKIYYKDRDSIIIFSVGVNDTQNINGDEKVSLEAFENNIISLINNAKKYTDNILFIGLTKVDESEIEFYPWNKDKCYSDSKIILFDFVLKEICLENNVDYIDAYDLLESKDLFDGLHLNGNGQHKVCNKIKSKIKQYF